MNKTILQIPMSVSLRNQAESAATDMGFSSLQEAVRVILNKMATKALDFVIVDKEERLSPQAEARYEKMLEDKKKGINWHKADSVDEFITQLYK